MGHTTKAAGVTVLAEPGGLMVRSPYNADFIHAMHHWAASGDVPVWLPSRRVWAIPDTEDCRAELTDVLNQCYGCTASLPMPCIRRDVVFQTAAREVAGLWKGMEAKAIEGSARQVDLTLGDEKARVNIDSHMSMDERCWRWDLTIDSQHDTISAGSLDPEIYRSETEAVRGVRTALVYRLADLFGQPDPSCRVAQLKQERERLQRRLRMLDAELKRLAA